MRRRGTGNVALRQHHSPRICFASNVYQSSDRFPLNQNGSAFIRIPFNLATTNELNYLLLRVRFDDGFAAFINGQLIASANAPTALQWDSLASAGNSDTGAVQFRDFDASQYISALRSGANVLAIQGLNVPTGSSDFLNDAELIVAQRRIIGEVKGGRAGIV